MLRSVNRYLDGWHGYFRAVWSPFANPFQFQDQFVRRRVRTMLTGRLGNGWWQCVLSNQVLRQVGLISLAERYAEYRQVSQVTPGNRAVPTRKGTSGGEPGCPTGGGKSALTVRKGRGTGNLPLTFICLMSGPLAVRTPTGRSSKDRTRDEPSGYGIPALVTATRTPDDQLQQEPVARALVARSMTDGAPR